jgi:PBSX family phage terminase large subunit
MEIKLNRWQTEVWDDHHRFKVVCAGRRSGKSTLAQLITLNWAITSVGKYWIVNPTYRQAKSIHWSDFKKLIYTLPDGSVVKINETDLSFELNNGSIIELKGAENPDSLRGVKLNGLVIDEIASIRNWDWLWQEVLRPTLTDYEAPVVFISTPKGYNHFFDLYNIGQKDNKLYKSWRFSSYDNPYVPESEIENAKQELTEDTFAQEYMADFRKFTGLVYKDFERDIHVCDPFDIPSNWYIYRGIDFGSTNPTVCLWVTVDNDDNMFIIDEYYKTGMTIDYHAGIINSSKYNNVRQTYGDPSGAQWIREFSQRNIYITPADKEIGTSNENWVRFGIEKVSERLKRKSGHVVPKLFWTNDTVHERGLPSLFIFKHCENTIKEFENYRWMEKSVTKAQDLNEPDKPEKALDHAMDALRYIVVSYKKSSDVGYQYKWGQDAFKIGKI